MSESSVPVPRPSEGQMEIKSCPFCGAVPTIRRIFDMEAKPERVGIEHPENWQCVLTGEQFNLAEWNRRPSVPTATQEQRDAGVAVVEYFAARKAVVTEQTDAAKEGRLQSNDQCPSWHRYLKSQDNLWSALEKWAARVQGENSQ